MHAGAWAYLALALAIDLAFGYNYGYVGRARPDQPSLIDVLGPWPQRLVPIILLVSVAMLILLLPWEVGRIMNRRRETRHALRDAPEALCIRGRFHDQGRRRP
jgi:uncharacterized membrane protein YwaF